MIIDKITEITIYESPDKGQTVYVRKNGDPPGMRQLHHIDSELEREMDRIKLEEDWMDILRLSEQSPALQEAVERAIILYNLIKQNPPTPWHPV